MAPDPAETSRGLTHKRRFITLQIFPDRSTNDGALRFEKFPTSHRPLKTPSNHTNCCCCSWESIKDTRVMENFSSTEDCGSYQITR